MFADLRNKVAVVTGSGSGIGRATAIALARQGASVVGCDINAKTAEETVALAAEQNLTIRSIHPVDLTSAEDARRVIDETIKLHGALDILANVAAVTAPFVPFAQTDFEKHWRFTLTRELDLVFLLTQAAWPHLIERGGGSIINVGSGTAHVGFEDMGALPHITAKAGVIALTRQLAAEGAKHRIRANSVSPGYVETPASAPVMAHPQAREGLFRHLMIKRFGKPEDVASCIVFLASGESSWVTAAEYRVDGGFTAL